MDTWADWIGVDPPHDLTHFLEQDGSVWSGNSTRVKHRGITTQSVGRHAELSSRMRVFVEALCFAEMNALGYQPTINMADVERLLTAGPPEDFLDRPALAEYEFSKLRVEEELNRWCNVSSRHGKFDPAEFIFERNFQVLVKAVQS